MSYEMTLWNHAAGVMLRLLRGGRLSIRSNYYTWSVEGTAHENHTPPCVYALRCVKGRDRYMLKRWLLVKLRGMPKQVELAVPIIRSLSTENIVSCPTTGEQGTWWTWPPSFSMAQSSMRSGSNTGRYCPQKMRDGGKNRE